MRAGMWVAAAATVGVLLAVVVELAANTVVLPAGWTVWIWVAVGVLSAATVGLAIKQYRVRQARADRIDQVGFYSAAAPVEATGDIPVPPALFAEPRYIGSHAFVGRAAELETLSQWAASDSHNVLLFEAIGGTGKSMLTWEWLTNHAQGVGDWAGRFWYSFYEKGAVLADFCRHALAYTTGSPVDSFQAMNQPELSDQLLRQLQARPWLIVLDGLERVLVAYHRYDAAQLADEDAGSSDAIAHRDPRAAIRPEDDELLRQLTGAGPSKILITSRLVPRVLLNPAGQPIPGVLHERLPGLRPPDAEALLRACGVHGESARIQDYLRRHCDCHPLVTGIVAGLVNDYLPDRGNFDAWAMDPDAGDRLNVAELDLVQKRNHILRAALAALPEDSRRLLSVLALLPDAADYETLDALNPYRPAPPAPVPVPVRPEDLHRPWEDQSEFMKHQARRKYALDVARYEQHARGREAWSRTGKAMAGARKLAHAVQDLERRGLLQYDRQAGLYDLHPVVRGIASSDVPADDRDRLGRRVIDHFTLRSGTPYGAATLDDLRDGLIIVRTYLQMGRIALAFDAYAGPLSDALLSRLEEYAEALSLLRPFFVNGWTSPHPKLSKRDASFLINNAAIALRKIGELGQANVLHQAAIKADLEIKDWRSVAIELQNLAIAAEWANNLAQSDRYSRLALKLAEQIGDDECLFTARLELLLRLARSGRWTAATELWTLLDPMGRRWNRGLYQPGEAELHFATFQFWQGQLTEEHLEHAERLAQEGDSRSTLRDIRQLRGQWLISRQDWGRAAECLREAIRMAHGASLRAGESETWLALAQLHLRRLTTPREEATRLAALRDPAHLALAELWLAIDDREQATAHALSAYRQAWADGEPHIHKYNLDRAASLLTTLDTEVPEHPTRNTTKDPWEHDIEAHIAQLEMQ